MKEQNARTLKILEGDPRFEPFRKQALALLTATDRILLPRGRRGQLLAGRAEPARAVAAHLLESYTRAAPKWETVLDVDALAKAEGKSWIFKGERAACPRPTCAAWCA